MLLRDAPVLTATPPRPYSLRGEQRIWAPGLRVSAPLCSPPPVSAAFNTAADGVLMEREHRRYQMRVIEQVISDTPFPSTQNETNYNNNNNNNNNKTLKNSMTINDHQ